MSKKKHKRRSEHPIGFFGGISIPLFILGLIFGKNELLIGSSVLLLLMLVIGLYFSRFAPARALLNDLIQSSNKNNVGLIIPLLVVAGIFGGDLLMLLILGLAALMLFAGVIYYAHAPQLEPKNAELPIVSLDKALPATSNGEVMPELNVRELCRGLPPSLSGQVMLTLEHLETVATTAEAHHDTRRAFNAKQGIQDYLPNTVQAWKDQPESQRHTEELEQALRQIRDIAGENNDKAAKMTWETQQRFLSSKSKEKV